MRCIGCKHLSCWLAKHGSIAPASCRCRCRFCPTGLLHRHRSCSYNPTPMFSHCTRTSAGQLICSTNRHQVGEKTCYIFQLTVYNDCSEMENHTNPEVLRTSYQWVKPPTHETMRVQLKQDQTKQCQFSMSY